MKQAWERRNDPNICMVFYEDLKADAHREVRRIAKFLNLERSEEQVNNIVKFTSFDNMKERSKLNPPTSNDGKYFNEDVVKKEGGFFRKGQVGDWKNRFNPQQVERIQAWMAKNLKDFPDDFKFKNT